MAEAPSHPGSEEQERLLVEEGTGRARQHLVQVGLTALEFGWCQRPPEREGRAQQNRALALEAVG
ncbi:hypothetical protein MC885_009887 [Smutsia gigantea]|nr:hypothetical protein MC885_009887 [Smutsia gigantea]